MIDKVGSSNLLQGYKFQPTENNKTKIATETSNNVVSKDIVSKNTADATKAYVQCIIAPPKREVLPQKTSEELIKDLINKGKIEGKDFIVDSSHNITDISILKDDKIIKKFSYYKNKDNKESYEGYTDYHYPLNTPKISSEKNIETQTIKYSRTSYTADGEFKFRTTFYDSKNSPYQNEEINAKTTSYQLSKYLESKNIPYTTNINFVNENCIEHKIIAFDKDTNKFIRYEISENKDNEIIRTEKNYLDEKGNISHSIGFSENETSYTEYKDSFVA